MMRSVVIAVVPSAPCDVTAFAEELAGQGGPWMGQGGRALLVEDADVGRAPHGVRDALLLQACVSDASHAATLVATLEARSGVAWAEVWVEAPCPVPLRFDPPGWIRKVCVSGNDDHDAARGNGTPEDIVHALHEMGVVAILDSVDLSRLDELKRAADNRILAFEEALERKYAHLVGGTASLAFAEVGSRGDHRFDLLLDPAESCVEGTDASWLPAVVKLLGPTHNRAVSVVYSDPGAPNQAWHADGQHLGHDAGWSPDGAPCPPYAICAFIPLVDLNADVGFTQFWPGSHAQSQLLGFGEACIALGQNADGVVRRGDAVLYDYRTLHRGMKNVSSSRRPVLQFLYSVPSYREVRNYGSDVLID